MSEKSRVDNILRLDKAWQEIEKSFTKLGSMVREKTADDDFFQRFEGYKTALAMIGEAYVNQVYYDRQRPECQKMLGPVFNFAGPAPDFLYKAVHLEPGASYRVWGRRGDAEIVDFHQVEGWYGQRNAAGEQRSITKSNKTLEMLNIEFDEQGNFDFAFSHTKVEGQWVKMEDNVNFLLIREYFTDYTSQGNETTFHFDKIDNNNQINTSLGIGESVARLEAVANSLLDYHFAFTMTKLHAEDGDNVYRDLGLGSNDSGGASDHRYLQARFNVKPDEALVGEWTVPEEYLYWSFALYNDFYQELNYGNRQVSLNHTQGKVGKDRKFYFVISHQDPGIANWLDPDGHEKGLILTRTKGVDGKMAEGGLPTLKLVPMNELMKYLPSNIDTVSGDERDRALRIRRRHYHLREKC